MITDKPISLYIDIPRWRTPLKQDDFVIAIGKKQSNSVYHVSEVKLKDRGNGIIRCYFKAYRSDLISMLKRDKSQKLITLKWYKR